MTSEQECSGGTSYAAEQYVPRSNRLMLKRERPEPSGDIFIQYKSRADELQSHAHAAPRRYRDD